MDEVMPVCLRLAQAYVPIQVYMQRWEPLKALQLGTIFPELYRPYYGWEYEGRN
ncbi:MAG TPA: spore coat associated protein CotJA [Bacillota bacterium]